MTPAAADKILIMIPTYNEVDNVGLIISRIRALNFKPDILFVDDNSPDGTGKLLDNLSQEDHRLHVLHRPGKLGVGSAHLDGIAWAYEHGYNRLVTMDSDQTHSPEDINQFLKKANDSDVVIGSRFLEKNSLVGWSPYRKLMTHTGHFLTQFLLQIPYDATGAFRCYNLGRIPHVIFETVKSSGYSFFYESLHKLHNNHLRIAQMPIVLPARTYGHSKMRLTDMVNGVVFLFFLAFRAQAKRSDHLQTKPGGAVQASKPGAVENEWDDYWRGQSGKRLYDFIAVFYRRAIIRPAVNHYLGKYFVDGASILHAGCGSGSVDVDMAKKLRITALDLSSAALTEYARHHPNHKDMIKGSILDIPAENGSFEGIFNLGVMEHFHEPEIKRAFLEFHRVLKPGGRLILFWPPAWGPTVIVMKAVHFVLNDVFRRNVKLHPDEHTLITSRKRTSDWLHSTGFDLDVFDFSFRDAFTHQVIIAEKRNK